MKYTSLLSYCILVLTAVWYLGTGCANVGNPTGGPKDTIPPQLVNIYPKPGSLNFKDRVIRLEFNERVTLKDLQNQLIITPRTENAYQTKIAKNVVELTFDQPFDDSTTYTLNFRNGVVDITEANPAKDLYLAFSTGQFLDSLVIRGKVRTALTNKAAEGAIVAVYNARDTATILVNKPAYFARSDKEGNYELRNLKAGRYLVYSMLDKNNNLTLQTKNESYGFWPDTLNLNASADSININLFSVNIEKPKLISARPSGSYFELTFNKPLEDYQLQVDANVDNASNFIDGQRKIRLYPFPMQADSIKATIIATDSIKQQLRDTVYVRFQESTRQKTPFAVSITPEKGNIISKSPLINLHFTKPVASVQLDSIRFSYDSIHWENVTAQELVWNKQRDRLSISKTLQPPQQQQQQVRDDNADAQTLARKGTASRDQSVNLRLPKGTFIGVEGDTVDNQEVSYKIATESQTGIISGNVQTKVQNLLIQLVRANNFKVVDEVKNTKEYIFRFVPPGEYLIRVITDRNGNGQWDPGDIYTLTPPEEVYIFPQPITIKANWEIKNPEISL